jgi:hypothetical protein
MEEWSRCLQVALAQWVGRYGAGGNPLEIELKKWK